MPKQVTCSSCRQSFPAPGQTGDNWIVCPYCKKMNPAIWKSAFFGFAGTMLFIAAILGGTLGTALVYAATIGFERPFNVSGIGLPIVWFVASVALFIASGLLLRGGVRGTLADVGWKTLIGALLAVSVGVGGWVFVFETCAFP